MLKKYDAKKKPFKLKNYNNNKYLININVRGSTNQNRLLNKF